MIRFLRTDPIILRPLAIAWLERRQGRALIRVEHWRAFGAIQSTRDRPGYPWQSYRRKVRSARLRRFLDGVKPCGHAFFQAHQVQP